MLTEIYDPSIVDSDLIREIKRETDKNRSYQYENTFPDAVVLEMYDLRENHKLSLRETTLYMKKKYGIEPSKSFVSRLSKIIEKRFSKQEFFSPNFPGTGLYPISSKRPTKTPEKANFSPKKPATQKAGKGVDPLEENEPVLGVEEISESLSASPEPETQEIPVKEEEKAQEMKPLSEPTPTDIKVNAPEEDGISEEDKKLEHNSVPEKKQANRKKNPNLINNDNQNNNTKKKPVPSAKKPNIKVEKNADEVGSEAMEVTEVLECEVIGRASDDDIKQEAQRKELEKKFKRKRALQGKKKTKAGLSVAEHRELWDLMELSYSNDTDQ